MEWLFWVANFFLGLLLVYLYLMFLSFGDRDSKFEIKLYKDGDEDPHVELGQALGWAVKVKDYRQKHKWVSTLVPIVIGGIWLVCAFQHGRTTAAGGGTVLGALMVIGYWRGFWGWIGNEGLSALEHSMNNTHKSRWGRAWSNVADKSDAWIMFIMFLSATATFTVSASALVALPNATGITLPLFPATTKNATDMAASGISLDGTPSGSNVSSAVSNNATFSRSAIAPYVYNATCLVRKGGHELLQEVDAHAFRWLDTELRAENVLGEAVVSFVMLMALCLASVPLPTSRVGRTMWRTWMVLVALQLLLSWLSLVMVVMDYIDAHSAHHACMLTTTQGVALLDFVMFMGIAFYPPVASKLALAVAHSGLLVEGMRVADVVEKRWELPNYGPKGWSSKWLLPFRLAKYDNGHGQGFGARVSLNMLPNLLICTCLSIWILTVSCLFSVLLLPVGFVVLLGLYGIWLLLRSLHHCATRRYRKAAAKESIGRRLLWLQVRGVFAAFDFDAPAFCTDDPEKAEFNRQHRLDLLLGSSSGLNTAVVYITLLATVSVPIFGGSLVAVFAYAGGSEEVMTLVGTLYDTSLNALGEHENFQWAWGEQFTEVMSPTAVSDMVNATATGTFEIHGSSYYRRAAALFLLVGTGLSVLRWSLSQILQFAASLAQRTCCKERAEDGHHRGHVLVDIGTCNDTAILYERFDLTTGFDGNTPPATKALQDVVEENRKSIDDCLFFEAGQSFHVLGFRSAKLRRQESVRDVLGIANPASKQTDADSRGTGPRRSSSSQGDAPKTDNQKRFEDVMSKNALGLDSATIKIMTQKNAPHDSKKRDAAKQGSGGGQSTLVKAPKGKRRTRL